MMASITVDGVDIEFFGDLICISKLNEMDHFDSIMLTPETWHKIKAQIDKRLEAS